MPTLGAPLDFSKYEGRNFRGHILGTAPSTPVTGQMYYNSGDNTLYWYDGTQWVSARGGASATPQATTSTQGTIQLAGDLAGTATSPQIAAGVITDTDVNSANKDGAVGTPSLRTLGVGAQQAAPGNDARFAASPPNGPASGDLAGTYPGPTVAALAITDAKVAAANKDGAVGTPSLRTLGAGANQALAGSARLDTIAATNPPTTPVALNGQKITGLADPTAAQDAATKAYVDSVAQGLDAKQSVKAATTADLAGGLTGAQTIDGVALVTGDRCLVKNQALARDNGIFIVASGAWTRATDMDAWTEVPGAFVFVEQGTTNADTGWVSTADQAGTLGTTAITWTQFSGAGAITDGIGLLKTGNTLDVRLDGTTVEAPADIVQVKDGGITGAKIAAATIDPSTKLTATPVPVVNGGTGSTTAATARTTLGAAGYYNNSATHGAGATITITQATHGLRATRAIHVQVQDNATGAVEIPDIVVAANGDVTVTYGASVTANTKLVTLVG